VSRIAQCFASLRARDEAALVAFFTCGDPDLATTRELVRAAVSEGADLIELGVPFSDPMADGPTLQRAARRALAAGTSLHRVLELVTDLRGDVDVPIVLFGYYNPFFRYGLGALARDAAAAGADGFLCVDLPPEEGGDFQAAVRAADLDLIFILAPTSGPTRIRTVARTASGFVYFVSVLGVTGARTELPRDLPDLVKGVRHVTDLPVGVGFGVSTPDQAAWIAGFADAVIVGSAYARIVEESERAEAPARVAEFTRALRRAITAARRRGSSTPAGEAS